MNEIKFKTARDIFGRENIYFNTDYSEECCRYIINNNIKKITLYPGTYKANDLTPLLPIKESILSIFILLNIDCKDITLFKNLKEISNDSKAKIDLSQFPHLESYYGKLSPNITGLDKAKKLETLYLHKYSTDTYDLSILPQLENLKHLGLFQTKIRTLKGIGNFPNLSKIQIYSASQLTKISDLLELKSYLTEIEFELCKNLTDYAILAKLTELKKLTLTQSGSLRNLSFIPKLKHLKFFSFWGTNIIDGDLSFCKNLDYVGFDNKRHYNLKLEYFTDKRDRHIK